ncbi:MAG: Glutathione hydrolase-like YwrD proenzyme [Gammaproteobacteria bacterium]|nr:Glutathione hydrolase-like YwrD proenzyme [Gammaproteobacteria bacterium]
MHSDIRWDEFPYPSRRVPVFARNVIATSQPLAVQAGVHMFRQGGNAVDAALAAAAALTVTEPCSNGLGSDAFAIVWDGQSLHGLNASGRSPRAWSLGRFEGVHEITTGWESITVPGCVDAWSKLSRRFGKLDFSQLLEPAIDYAQYGYPVSPTVQGLWTDARETYRDFEGFNQVFCPKGRAPVVGELFGNTAMAGTLRCIAESHGEDFYRGRTARRIVEFLNRGGSVLSEDDLADHRSEWVEPIRKSLGNVQLCEIPPNGQGIAALIALGILDYAGIEKYDVDTADSVHLQIEAVKAAFQLVQAHVADRDHMHVSVDDLLDETRLSDVAAGIDINRASDPLHGRPGDGGTVYLTAADEGGVMVSFIQSNFWGFGSGVVDPTTGISFQNRAAGFSLDPAHPNCISGGKRPFHTIIPGFVMHDESPLMSFGVMGGHMQAQGHVQMMVRIFCHGQNPQAASDAPRWFVDDKYDVVFESGFDVDVQRALRQRGHRLSATTPLFAFGGAQLIYRLENGFYCAASDHRKDGHAAGY